MRITAVELLRTYGNPSLQQMARQRGLEVKQKSKEQIVNVLAPVLYDADAVARSLADLTPLERRLLDRLILADGDVPTALIRRTLEREALVEVRQRDAGSYLSYYAARERGSVKARGSKKFVDLVARLGGLGLVFTAEPVHSSGSLVDLAEPGRRLLIPEEILRHLPPVELSPEIVPAPATIQEGDPAPLLLDLYLLLSFVAREPIPLTARGLVVKRTLVRLDEALRSPEGAAAVRSEEELTRLPLLRALTEELGLLVASVGELLLDARAEEFLRLPAAERRQRLYAAYRRTGRWNEIYRVPNLSVRGKGASLRAAAPGVVAARQRVLTELRELPPGEWIALDHLVERMRLRAYEFLFSRRWAASAYYYYSSYYDSDNLPNPYRGTNELGLTFDVDDEQRGWTAVEAGFIRAIVREGLHALGVVDLGEEGGTATAFRITDDGARLLRGEPLPSVETATHVVVQPNFQIFAFEPTGENVLFTLDQVATRVRADQAIEYDLTRDSVYRAQRAGLDAQAIVQFLESVSTVGLPQNVRRTLEEWGSQHERITLRRRTPLLHAVDAATLDALYADADLAPLLGRRVAPTVALVPSANLGPLADRLLAGGHLPALSEGADDLSGPPLGVEPEGRLAFRQPLPSIYDLHALRRFADEEGGAMRLTPASLRRGAKANLSADDILATIERLHAAPLPPEIPALVRRWAKDWGRGALLKAAAVLQVEHPETLTDLLADPAVRPLLQQLPGAPMLALVSGESLARLRELLDDLGMALGDRPLR